MESSPERETPKESNYLATSPWQILNFEAENRYKKDITLELLRKQKIKVTTIKGTTHDQRIWNYRNKMEYGFWDDKGNLRLALYQRGSHALQAVNGSVLAMPGINQISNNICILLAKTGVWANALNSIIIRSSQTNQLAASLFVKSSSFPKLEKPNGLKGLRVYHTRPTKSGSTNNRLLYELGDCRLEDNLLDHKFTYDTDSFFQINLPVFELTLKRIKEQCQSDSLVDIYAGVGSIGLSVARSSVDLMEKDSKMVETAAINAQNIGINANIIKASIETALNFIVKNKPVIVDPPRIGLHDKVVQKLLITRPFKVVYLSCNPATQARDLAKLQSAYDISHFEIFNYFPRTPHIETLAVLTTK